MRETTTEEEPTPGPWTVRYGVCRNDHPDTSADVHGRDGQFVADCGCHEWANANARLIAAAPDLLEACRDLVDRFERKATSKASLSCSYAEAKAAIAKADRGGR